MKIEFIIVVDLRPLIDALRDIANKIFELLSGVLKVIYSGQDYVVDEVTVTDNMGQNTSKHKLYEFVHFVI